MFGAISAAVGAIVGATGQSINQMIVSGIIFGIGGGFQEMCFACAQELVPNKYRFQTLGKQAARFNGLDSVANTLRRHDFRQPLQFFLAPHRIRFHRIHQDWLESLLLVVPRLGGCYCHHALFLLSSTNLRDQASG